MICQKPLQYSFAVFSAKHGEDILWGLKLVEDEDGNIVLGNVIIDHYLSLHPVSGELTEEDVVKLHRAW